MKYAFKNGQKILASNSGDLATCPWCKSDVRAHCGRFVIWHWKHVSKYSCDPWWEPETEWHRNWKDYFPKEWQEVIHHDPITNEKHIADLKNDSGIVVEFQNSSISYDELLQRENFYKKLVWVVNAEPFKCNLILENRLSKENSKIYHRFELEKDLVQDQINQLKGEENSLDWTWNYERVQEQKKNELLDKIEKLTKKKINITY